MYRHYRPFARPVSAFARRSSRPLFTRQSGDVRVQRVRFLRPIFRGWLLPKILFWSIAINLAWISMERQLKGKDGRDGADEHVSMKEAVKQARATTQTEPVGIGGEVSAGTEEQVTPVAEVIEDDELDEEGDEWDEDEDDLVPEDQPEDAWFIPLWFAREGEQYFYAGDDPEWIGFMEFNEDMGHRNAVKHTLIKFIYEKTMSNPKFRHNIGAPVKVGRVWLEFFYPYGPPPELERFGIEITDEYVALLHRPVDPGNASRVENAIWPQKALRSLWASFRYLWDLERARFQETWDGADDDGDPEGTDRAGQKAIASAGEDSDEPASSMPSIRVPTKGADQKVSLPLPPLPQPSAELKEAMMVFRRTFARESASRKVPPPPRGALLCAGRIELVGQNDILVVDVQSFYHPEKRAITYVNAVLESARPVIMRPKGGSARGADEGDEEDEGSDPHEPPEQAGGNEREDD